MSERPILFSAPMVKAILDGQKTMTRRVNSIGEYYISDKKCPYGVVGDRLWVRETWQSFFSEEVTQNHQQGARSFSGVPAETVKGHYMFFYYRADGEVPDDPKYGKAVWRPSIFMPRWASRITLEITDIKVERLQDITEEDAAKEGINQHPYEYADSTYYDERPEIAGLEANIAAFAGLWDSINGQKPGKTWQDNPWVWVIEFKRINND